jgi:hypothetical protein
LSRDAVGYRPPDSESFPQRAQDFDLRLVRRCELLYQLIADVAVLGVGFAVLGEEFDVMLVESVVIPKSAKESAARQLIRILVAAVRRRHLL